MILGRRLKPFLKAFLNFLDQYRPVEERITGMPSEAMPPDEETDDRLPTCLG